jgi:hypothetical protein
MYSGKIAVPPGGGGIRKKNIKFFIEKKGILKLEIFIKFSVKDRI